MDDLTSLVAAVKAGRANDYGSFSHPDERFLSKFCSSREYKPGFFFHPTASARPPRVAAHGSGRLAAAFPFPGQGGSAKTLEGVFHFARDADRRREGQEGEDRRRRGGRGTAHRPRPPPLHREAPGDPGPDREGELLRFPGDLEFFPSSFDAL